MLNPVRFEELFIAWAQSLKDNKTSETEHDVSETVIAVDGKTSGGSKDSYHKKSPPHVVNAWCVGNGICPGRNKADDKSNEITAIPELLKLLDINGDY
jgi:hypothetical protein